MLEYLQENSFFTLLLGLSIGGLAATFAIILRHRRLGIVAVAALLMTIGLVTYERISITDREQIVQSIYEMADCVRRNDVDGLLQYVSQRHPANYRRIKNEMPDYVFDTCYINTWRVPRVDSAVTPPRAAIDFVVYVKVDATVRYGYVGNALRGVTLHFEKEPDESWRVVDYRHYDPRSGR